MSNPENETRDPLAGMNLSGLEGLGDERDLEADELAKLEADGKLLLWEADELPPAENQAFSLRLLVNDSGTAVAYVQLEGESFARREVRVQRRLGNEALVDGLRAGERLVTQGAGAVRRASLLSAGAPEGHVH